MQHTYVNQPVLPPGVKPGLVPQRRRRRVPWPWLAAVVGVGLIIVGLLGHAIFATQPIPASVQQAASFPLFYPSWLPAGACIDPKSFDVTSQVVTFNVQYDQGKKLLFSEQPKPVEFDFATFYEQQLTDTKSFSTAIGSTVVGLFDHAPFASVASDRTWVLISAPDNISKSDLEHIARKLHKS